MCGSCEACVLKVVGGWYDVGFVFGVLNGLLRVTMKSMCMTFIGLEH